MKSFVYAFRGIWHTVRTERNMRIHLCAAFYVAALGLIAQIDSGEWLAVLLCIAAVISLECVNTALESLCDALCPEKNEGVRRCKDAAAGAVLVAAIISAVVGGLVFFRAKYAATALAFIMAHPVPAAILLLTLIPALLFVRGGVKGEKKDEK